MKKTLLFLTLSFALLANVVMAQCPVCTYTLTQADFTPGYGPSGSGTYCINGNVTGNFSYGPDNSTICVNGNWTMTNNSFYPNNTAIIIPSTGTFSAPLIGLGSSVSIHNEGSLNFTSTSDFPLSAGIVITNDGGTMTSSGKINVQGATLKFINNASGTLAVLENNEGVVTIDNSSTLNVTGEYYNHGELNNEGTIHAGTLKITLKTRPMTNDGLILVDGNIDISGALTNNGGIETINGNVNLTGNANLSGDGTGYVWTQNGTQTNTATGAPGNVTNVTLITGANNTFPVKLTYFRAKEVNKTIELQWATSEQTEISYTYVEKSSDARSFERYAAFKGEESLSNREYVFTDDKPKIGNNYYRLAFENLDGTTEYSKIINVTYEGGFGTMIFENPAKGQTIQISTDIENPKFMVHDIMGKEVSIKVSKEANKYAITPKKYVYDMLIVTMYTDKGKITKKAILQD